MRIAIAGKGGAGKTTISATLCRLLARQGRRVVAIDADSNPNLAIALGVDRRQASLVNALPQRPVSRRFDGPRAHRASHGRDRAVRRGGTRRGTRRGDGRTGARRGRLSLLGAYDRERGAQRPRSGPRHRGDRRHGGLPPSISAAAPPATSTPCCSSPSTTELPIPRIAVAANKVARPDDLAAIAEFCARHGLELTGQVPYSEILKADLEGVPLIEPDGHGDAVTAIARLASSLLG